MSSQERLNVTRSNADRPPWARLFVRLPATTRPGDAVKLPDWPRFLWRVETAKLADDGRDAKCVVVLDA
jgi:hypothetical protein